MLSSPPVAKPCPSERTRRDIFDGLAKKWDSTVRFDEFKSGIGRCRRRLIQRAEGDVLEVAIGSGRNFSYYNSAKVRSVTGVDFSRAMLEVADGKRAELQPIPLKLKLAHSQRLDFQDGAFDTVVDTFGICSFEEPVEALREMRRVLKDDGQVLLLEHGASNWEMVQGLLNRSIHGHVEKYGCYPNRKIAALVREAGLHIVLDERKHFGTTYVLVCRKSAPVLEEE
uniref:Methyltransferase type 11 domain-containing protein n=1 Tax=Zooxanthella nutricula TaxID=1333877 RepID=A0A7S2QF67_9DINO